VKETDERPARRGSPPVQVERPAPVQAEGACGPQGQGPPLSEARPPHEEPAVRSPRVATRALPSEPDAVPWRPAGPPR